MRVVHFAQGDFMMLGMYLAYYFAVGYHIDPLLGALLALPPFFAAGWLVHRGLLARVTGGGDPQRQLDATLILTLGLSLIITNATTMILSPMPRAIRTGYATEAFVLGPILVNQARSYAFLMAVLLAALVYLFLTRTDLGKALRAAADEPEAAGYQGIDVRTMHGVAFGIGVALVAGHIRRLPAAGVTVAIIEHTMSALVRLADRLLVLDHGRCLAEGPPGEVTREAAVIEAYLGTRWLHRAQGLRA